LSVSHAHRVRSTALTNQSRAGLWNQPAGMLGLLCQEGELNAQPGLLFEWLMGAIS
jgi:hypothetical protein